MVPCTHLGIMFYWAIKHDTMEVWRFCVWWNVGTLLDMLILNWPWGPFLNVPSLATRGGGGVKFAHHIQTLILFLKKRVTLARASWLIKVFIYYYYDLSSLFMLNLTRVMLWGFWLGSIAWAKENLRSIFCFCARMMNNAWVVNSGGCIVLLFIYVAPYMRYQTTSSHHLQHTFM